MPESILNWLQVNEERDLGAALVRLARLAEAAHRDDAATGGEQSGPDCGAASADSRPASPRFCTSNDPAFVDP